MSDSTPVIAIVGAGMGGLTAAATLTAVGYQVVVFEQAPAFARVGAGIQIGANALRVLGRLGVTDALCKIAVRPERLFNRSSDTDEELSVLHLGDTYEAAYGAPYLLLHRGDLHSTLATMIPPSVLQLGKRLRDIAPVRDGVELSFADDTRFRADAVVAADGLNSQVHQILFDTPRPHYSGRVAYRSVFPTSLVTVSLEPDAVKWWGPDRHFVTYTITQGQEVYFVTSVPEPDPDTESWSAQGDMDQLRAEFEGFPETVQLVLKACPQAWRWGIYVREPLPVWSEGPIVLLGDSCHPMTPYMAQGAGMAIEDAAVLARCLEGATDLPAAFNRYQRTRQERTARVQQESARNPLMGQRDLSWLYGYDAWTTPLAPITP